MRMFGALLPKIIGFLVVLHGLQFTSAQSSPSNIAQDEADFIANSTAALQSSPDGRNTLSESQPEDFVCDVKFKPHAMTINSVRTLVGIVDYLAIIASQKFDVLCPTEGWDRKSEDTTTRVIFRNGKQLGSIGFQAKTMMWSLSEVAHWYSTQDHYGEVSFTSYYRGEPLLGVGQLLYVPPTSDELSNGTGMNDQFPSNNHVRVRNSDIKKVADMPVYEAPDVYSMIIAMMVGAAGNESVREVGIPTFVQYNGHADASLVIERTSERAEKLGYGALIITLGEIANKMPYFEVQSRWKQFTFLIRDEGKIIGRGALLKGRLNDADVSHSLDALEAPVAVIL